MANTVVVHEFIGRALCVFGLGLVVLGCGGDDSGQSANASSGTPGGRGRDDRGGESRPADMQGAARVGTAGASGSAGMGGAGHAGAAGKAPAPSADKGAAGRAGAAAEKTPAKDSGGTRRDAGAREPEHDQDAGPSKPDRDDADAGSACTPLTTPQSVTYPKCSEALCPAQDSVCVPASELPPLAIPAGLAASLADCGDGSRCVPTAVVEQAGHAVLPRCASIAGAEGRCVSACVPIGPWQESQLPQDVCPGSTRCAPCYDPLDGHATGACGLGCDPGPMQPAQPFTACCAGAGRCMPPQLADATSPAFVRDACDEASVCVPNALTDVRATPQPCASFDGAEGRCLSPCLAALSSLPGFPNQGCASDEVCTPCFDPITGASTGACNIHGDAPAQPVYRFPGCCASGGEALGRCVPQGFAPSSAGLFARDTCAGDRVCEPTAKLLDPNYHYPACAGGACIPTCLVDPLDALLFTNLFLCALDEICVPCSVSGACD